MKKYLCLIIICLFFSAIKAFAEPIKITPVKKITTANKYFQLGDIYKFKDIKTGNLITGIVSFYRPNGFCGQEAQIEITNFRDENYKKIPGKITIIPTNHKNYQEFMNYYSSVGGSFVRGSEVTLRPEKHIFIINNATDENEVVAINLKPSELISTVHDELEVGDLVKFNVLNDVYKSDKLFIKAKTPMYGVIDYLDENGWCGDNANLHFIKFITTDSNGQKIIINSPLDIEGWDILKYKSKRFAQFFNYIGVYFRGKEVDIKPYDTKIQFNLIVK